VQLQKCAAQHFQLVHCLVYPYSLTVWLILGKGRVVFFFSKKKGFYFFNNVKRNCF
jgi:hypothetical protein